MSRWGILSLTVAFEGGLAVLAILLAWIFSVPLHESAQLSGTGLLLGIAATIPMGLAFLWAWRTTRKPMVQLKDEVERHVVPLFAHSKTMDLVVIAALAGLGEELLFRGVIQALLVEWTSLWPGVILASVLFGLAHAISTAYLIYAALVGLYLGGIYVATGNLLVPALAHGLYDFALFLYLLHAARTKAEQ
jgi:membrane protease YdiL (CAAX protease family)